MVLTPIQVIAKELAILITYFCYKETQSGNVTKRKIESCYKETQTDNVTRRKKPNWKLSENKNQEATLPKLKKNLTESRKRKVDQKKVTSQRFFCKQNFPLKGNKQNVWT